MTLSVPSSNPNPHRSLIDVDEKVGCKRKLFIKRSVLSYSMVWSQTHLPKKNAKSTRSVEGLASIQADGEGRASTPKDY